MTTTTRPAERPRLHLPGLTDMVAELEHVGDYLYVESEPGQPMQDLQARVATMNVRPGVKRQGWGRRFTCRCFTAVSATLGESVRYLVRIERIA